MSDSSIDSSSSQRLNKFLAFHLGVSRREADSMIEKGRVTIDDTPAIIGARVDDTQTVAIDSAPIERKHASTYIAFHKPTGYVCSRKRQGDTPTIYELLPTQYHTLKPVGRLDADSSGLLLLTDDGDFTLQMTHPRFYKQKRYEVSLDSDLQPLHQQMINDFGVQLEDGPSQLTLERQSDDSRKDWHVLMSEGRNRQIRRTFAALGYTVVSLHRTQFGTYQLDSLPSGEFSIITQ